MKVKLNDGRVFVDNVEVGYYVKNPINRTWYAELTVNGTIYVKSTIYKNDLRALISEAINE